MLLQIIYKNTKIDFASFIREIDYSFLPFAYFLKPIYKCKTLLVVCLNVKLWKEIQGLIWGIIRQVR